MRMKSRKQRTVDDLQNASDHLYYEIWMLTTLADGLASEVAGNGPIANALLESFIIHVRVVIDFLYAIKQRPDDVIAEDFFDAPEQWTDMRPTLSELLSQTKSRADKKLAHLSYERLNATPENNNWQVVQIAS
jgi:hypothetical protein